MRSCCLFVALAAVTLSLAGCGPSGCGATQYTAPVAAPTDYIVLLDLSASRTPELRDEGAQFIAQLSKALNFGDHISVLQVQNEGLSDHPKHWADDMPKPVDPHFPTEYDQRTLETEQENVRVAVEQLSKPPVGEEPQHTDLFTTLGLAGQYARDYPGIPVKLILLSDMLQSTRAVEMDHAARMPPQGWVDEQKRRGLLPNFGGACVLVVGADGVTPSGEKVRDFWQRFFDATGAHLPASNYRARPPLTGSVGCS